MTYDDDGKGWPMLFMLHNLENYWTTRWFIEAARRVLPCTDADCQHPYHRPNLPRGGFQLCRRCSANAQKWEFVMCDKLGCQVRGLRRNNFGGLHVLLCMFHVIAAMLDKFAELGVKDSTTLYVLLVAIKMIRQSRTFQIAKARFKIFKEHVLPRVIADTEKRRAVSAYMETNWMTDSWMPAWVDAGRISKRILSPITTAAQCERLWLDVMAKLFRHKQVSVGEGLSSARAGR